MCIDRLCDTTTLKEGSLLTFLIQGETFLTENVNLPNDGSPNGGLPTMTVRLLPVHLMTVHLFIANLT